jgi:hypothetical protein
MSFLGIMKVIGSDALKVLGAASGVAQIATPVFVAAAFRVAR